MAIRGVPPVGVNISMVNFNQVKALLGAIPADAAYAAKLTMLDFKTRGGPWAAAEVVKTYNITRKDVLATHRRTITTVSGVDRIARSTHKYGATFLAGEIVGNIQLVFQGRVLTPLHFNMLPKIRPKGRVGKSGKRAPEPKYSVTAMIFRGKRIMLNPSFAFLGRAHGQGPTLPWMRKRIPGGGHENSRHLESIKTLSVPQMITNRTHGVAQRINVAIEIGLEPRLLKHLYDAVQRRTGKRVVRDKRPVGPRIPRVARPQVIPTFGPVNRPQDWPKNGKI